MTVEPGPYYKERAWLMATAAARYEMVAARESMQPADVGLNPYLNAAKAIFYRHGEAFL